MCDCRRRDLGACAAGPAREKSEQPTGSAARRAATPGSAAVRAERATLPQTGPLPEGTPFVLETRVAFFRGLTARGLSGARAGRVAQHRHARRGGRVGISVMSRPSAPPRRHLAPAKAGRTSAPCRSQFEALLTAARESANVNAFALIAMLALLGFAHLRGLAADMAELGEEHGDRVLRVVVKGTKVVLVSLVGTVRHVVLR